ncbi:hypothetical protein SORBI_3003G318650 [Sorghum bicolor]|uniref:Uncharacterized protein n=1 Tax=Sorghum bicolor TaxID=4558 RepID=A0A1W0VZX2_SORBI|nr:hypothetical protein SORBI_3003G318650 [Sorghum bicolor]
MQLEPLKLSLKRIVNTVIFFLIHLPTEYGHHESSGHVASCSGEKKKARHPAARGVVGGFQHRPCYTYTRSSDAGRGSTEMRWRRLQGRPVLPACAARRKRCPHSLHGLSDLVHRGNAAILGSIRRRRRFDRSQGMMP